MKPPAFEYVAAASVEEAVAELARHGDEAKLLAGGQSLIPILNMRLASPRRLIDLNRVRELAYIEERDGGVAIGAMTRQRTLERSAVVRARLPLLAEAIPWVGHVPIRNRGTIGGPTDDLLHRVGRLPLPQDLDRLPERAGAIGADVFGHEHLVEVDVGIDEGRRQEPPAGLDLAGARARTAGAISA